MYVSSGDCGVKPIHIADRPCEFKIIHGPCSETNHHKHTPDLPPCCDFSVPLQGGILQGKIH